MLLKENRTADVIGSLISILTRAGHARMIGQLMLATSYPLSWFFLIVVPSKNKNVKELCVTRSNSYKKSLTVAILPLAFPGALCTGIYSGMLWSQDTRKPIDSFQIRIRRLAYFPCATLQDEFQFPETFHLKSDFHLSLSLRRFISYAFVKECVVVVKGDQFSLWRVYKTVVMTLAQSWVEQGALFNVE